MQIDVLLAQNQIAAAEELVPKIRDEAERQEMLRRISNAYLEQNQPQQAESVALSIPVNLLPPSPTALPSPRNQAIEAVADYYISAGQLESALAMVEYLDDSARGSLWLEIAEQYQQQGEPTRALPLIDRAFAVYYSETAPEFSMLDPNLARWLSFFRLNRFAENYAAAGASEKATALVTEMAEIAQTFPEQNLLMLTTLTSAARILKTAGQNQQADQVMTFVVQSSEQLEKPYLRAMLFSDLVKFYADLNEPDRAADFLMRSQLFTEATEPGTERDLAVIKLVQAYSALKQYNQALQVTDDLESPDLRVPVRQAIACAQSSVAAES